MKRKLKKKATTVRKPVKKKKTGVLRKKKSVRRKSKINIIENKDSIFDSSVGKTEALFIDNPTETVEIEVPRKFESLQEAVNEMKKEIETLSNQASFVNIEVPVKGKKTFWKRFFPLNNKLISIFVGLIFGGLFCSGFYVLAYVSSGVLNPGCAPGTAGCTVAPPLTDSFTGSFSGSGDFTTTGSFHVKKDNTYQYFGSADQAKIYYNGHNLVIDAGAGINTLGIGSGNLASYELDFSTSANHGKIIYTGASKTFDFGNNTGNTILTTGLSMEDDQGNIIYTMPTLNSAGVLTNNGTGTLTWSPAGSSFTDGIVFTGKLTGTGAAGILGSTTGSAITLPAGNGYTNGGGVSGAGGSVSISAGNGGGTTQSGTVAGAAGTTTISSGNGGISGSSTATAGGALNITAGGGGSVNYGGSATAPNGGTITITSGNPGVVGSAGGNIIAGSAGNLNLTTPTGGNGTGGNMLGGSGGSSTWTLGGGGTVGGVNQPATGGNAGSWTFTGGIGGQGQQASGGAPVIGGSGSSMTVNLGAGASETNAGGTGSGTNAGVGGSYALTSGAGGSATNGGVVVAGNAGNISLTANAGGNATGGSDSNTGGNGGSVTLQAGKGGTGATANGTDGKITLKSGATTLWTIDSAGKLQSGTDGTAAYAIATTGIGTFGDVLLSSGSAPATVSGMLYNSGTNVYAYEGSWINLTNASSLRFKHDIQPLTDDWSKILQVQPKSFLYNEQPDSSRNIGYIAEDFDALGLSDLVQYDSQGRPNGINYDKITLYDTEVIKQQQIDINAIKSRLGIAADSAVIAPAGIAADSQVADLSKRVDDLTLQLAQQKITIAELQHSQVEVQAQRVSEPAPQPQKLDIVSVAPIADMNVAYGTALDSINLPATVLVTMSDNSTQDVAVSWDNGNPPYDPNTAGIYVFSGTLANANNLTASVNVIIAEQALTQNPLNTISDLIQGAWKFVSWLFK